MKISVFLIFHQIPEKSNNLYFGELRLEAYIIWHRFTSIPLSEGLTCQD